MKDKISYQSANVLPVKVIYDTKLTNTMLYAGKVLPRVLQITPTNRCDLACKYCCCSEVDRKQELEWRELKEIVDIAKKLDVQAIVITGGGEPMLHKDIIKLIDYIDSKHIKVSLITNGNHFKDGMQETLSKLQWCRISFDDDRKITEKYKQTLEIASQLENVNFSFSYLYKGNTESDFLNIMDFVNSHDNFSHVRVINDSLSEDYINTLEAKEYLEENGVDTAKCFFKLQQEYYRGQEKCYMSLAKPRITASGDIYPCCAIQYQKANGLKKYNKRFSMGHYTQLEEVVEKQAFFDGRICDHCYYENYNRFLGFYMEPEKITDKEFI